MRQQYGRIGVSFGFSSDCRTSDFGFRVARGMK
jgi:hypothetical protein